MTESSVRTQESVNGVWADVWRKEPDLAVRELFGQRLFIEGYRAFRGYVPADTTSLLDVGGGTGRYGIRFALDFPKAQVYVTDILPESIAVASRNAVHAGASNVHLQIEDMFAFSFPDNHFDVVFCDVVIQHVEHPELALREMHRVLKPGGTLIVSAMNVWNFHSLTKLVLGRAYRYGYEKAYTRDSLARLAQQVGFSVQGTDGFYPAYGIYRLKSVSGIFRVLGKIANRLTKVLDSGSGRFF
jgi:SAM-dependent methyltransferase